MLTENDVINFVVRQLIHSGYRIISKCTTSQKGVDIVARLNDSDSEVLVEAKGATSSKPKSSRYGQEFNRSQVTSHIAKAIYAAGCMLTSNASSKVILAFPDNRTHREELEKVIIALMQLSVSVWLISDKGEVSVWI